MERADKKNEKKGGGGGLKTIKNASTQVMYQKTKIEDKKNAPKPKKRNESIKNKNGHIIGKDPDDDRWQCKVCSFKNPQEVEICSTCDSTKGEEKQKH